MTLLFSLSASATIASGVNGSAPYVYRNDGTYNNGYTHRKDKVDMKYLTQGLQAYQNGSLPEAMKGFKKSARLGNKMSKYLTAWVHFENNETMK